jgi:hypothetical protein
MLILIRCLKLYPQPIAADQPDSHTSSSQQAREVSDANNGAR